MRALVVCSRRTLAARRRLEIKNQPRTRFKDDPDHSRARGIYDTQPSPTLARVPVVHLGTLRIGINAYSRARRDNSRLGSVG